MLLMASTAQAVDFEASIGRTEYTKSDNGIWYQNGFYNDFSDGATSYSLGFTGYAYESVKWHAGYANLGQVASYALAVPDAQYNGVNGCYAPCTLDQYIGKGSIEGIYITLAPEMQFGKAKVFVEGGIWGYIPHFNMKVYRGTGTPATPFWDATTDEHMQFCPVFGFGVEYDSLQIVATIYSSHISSVEHNTIAFWNETVTNISIRKAF